MRIGDPELLRVFSEAELKEKKGVFELNNFSNRFDFPDRDLQFTHAPVKGTLEVEVTPKGIMATAHVEEVEPKGGHSYDPEEVKRRINSAGQVQITGANAYDPGSNITLYSYPEDDFPGWSFHCDLSRKS